MQISLTSYMSSTPVDRRREVTLHDGSWKATGRQLETAWKYKIPFAVRMEQTYQTNDRNISV